jgi:hypothetical protein
MPSCVTPPICRAPSDLLYSRFGVMFFDQPAQPSRICANRCAVAGRLRLRSAGAHQSDNPVGDGAALCRAQGAQRHTGVRPIRPRRARSPLPTTVEGARHPGPTRGSGKHRLDRYDTQVVLGPSPRAAAERALRIGPTARLAREVEEQHGDKPSCAPSRARCAVRRVRWSGES